MYFERNRRINPSKFGKPVNYPNFTNLISDYYEFVFASLEIIYPQRAMAKEFADQNSVWDPNPVFYCFVPGSWFKYWENIKATGRRSG